MDVLTGAISAAWDMLYQAGLYVVIGLLAAGLVHVFVSRAVNSFTRFAGGEAGAKAGAAACSCGGRRRQRTIWLCFIRSSPSSRIAVPGYWDRLALLKTGFRSAGPCAPRC